MIKSDVKTWIEIAKKYKEESNKASLTLATLCDMVLGEDADDRSNEALIRAVRELLNKVERI